jgi:hypothetical protein
MSHQLLNGPRWRPAHRQVRTKRVTKHVRPVVQEPGTLRCASNEALNHPLC